MVRRSVVWGCLVTFIIGIGLTAAAAPIEIELWGWAPGSVTGDKLVELIEEYNNSQDRVRVVMTKPYEGLENLIVAYAAGAAPDITFNVADMARAVGGPEGLLLPLDAFIDGPNGFPRDAFIPDMWSFSIVDGTVYQLAIEGNERGLFINTNLAAQAGLDTTQYHPIRDWNDLLDWARKLTIRKGDEVVQWGFNAHQRLGGDKWHWVWLNDGQLITPDGKQSLITHPNTVEAVQFAADLIYEYQVSPYFTGTVTAPFIQGQFAMVIERSTMIANLYNQGFTDFITVPGPVGVGKEGGRFSGASASAIAIINTTKYPEEAWDFVRWITYERGLEFAEARGGIPYLVEGLQSERFRTQPWEAFAYQMIHFRPETMPYGLPNDAFSNLFTAAWNQVISGQLPASVALAEAHEAANARLAAYHASKNQ